MGPIRNPRWEQKRTEGYVIVSSVSAELQRGPIRHNGAKTKLQLKHKKLAIYASNISL
jgi:hypothetical protein